MEENKYYIPEIDEFFVGFEFEEWENPAFTNEEWIAKKIEYFTDLEYVCIPEVDKHLENYVLGTSLFRVKSLDKEDLVELGFKPTYIKEAAELIGGFDMHINEQYKILLFLTGENHVFIFRLLHCDDPSTGRWKTDLFDGKIKNKSELIKVLKMLGIK